jgi:murein DD-endopeptidase MepM/ murein hydrolase activator NlpD
MEPTLLPSESCNFIAWSELSAVFGRNCSQQCSVSESGPGRHGRATSPSSQGSAVRTQRLETRRPRNREPYRNGSKADYHWKEFLSKRFYIVFVARTEDGQLRKIPIPLHYLYVLLAGAGIAVLCMTGIASSYTRMLVKVSHFNQLRTEKDQLKKQYSRLEEVAKERDIQVASLGSLAGEVSSLYGLKSDPILTAEDSESVRDAQVHSSLDQLYALKTTALSGAASTGISLGMTRNVTTADWVLANAVPNVWPVEGPITGSFGERIDPFNGEGAFHSGVDISSLYGQAVVAPADGVVEFADFMGGYGRAIIIDHGRGLSTRYGHLSNFAVVAGQRIRRGDTIGYVGLSGRSTGPHLHYEVRINDTPVNPHKYLRLTLARSGGFSAGS